MFKEAKFLPIMAKRVGIMIAISSIVVLATACASSATPSANPAVVPGNTSPTSEPVSVPNETAVPTQVAAPAQASSPAGSSSNPPDACTLLTKDDVSQVLGIPVDSAVLSGMGGMCTYTAKNLSIAFLIAGHTGGKKAMATTLARLGDLALVVPGLGDQAYFNTNPDGGSPLFLLKGDAEFNISMSDLNYQPLDPAVVQATEKDLAVKLLSNLQ